MKKTGGNPKITLLILTTVLLSMSFVFIGCGAFEDDNNQPSIKTITDQTLNLDDKITVDVNITDADIDDTHTINASSDDRTVATVSVGAASITITAKAEGVATITVSATDDSGQDNAAATPVAFKVTVNEPPPPPPIRANRVCKVGMTLGPGESCGYGPKVVFSVREDGTACRASSQPIYHNVFGIDVRIDNPSICGNHDIGRDDFFNTSFSASKNEDGSWTIKSVPALNIY